MGQSDRREGVEWLGHPPDARAGLPIRLASGLWRLVGFGLLRFHLRVEGREHLPAGGYILACAMHRSWIDPIALTEAVPLQPRVWYLGSAETVFRSRWRRVLMRWLGGFLPVWRGGTDIESHVETVQATVDAGAVLGIFPEGSRRGTELELQPFRRGTGLVGLRTRAPIVPAALAGTKELYLGKRFAVRLLPPVDALALAVLDEPPAPGSAAELEAARRATLALADLIRPHAAELAAWAADPPERPRRWTWLSRVVG
jgi:1-acyl-sn-glycerol-3-phosphate acyltransferase